MDPPDIAWVVAEPHSLFRSRELRTFGMCGYWDLSAHTSRPGREPYLLPGVQRSILDAFGDRRTAILKDTARVVRPHARYSQLDDEASRGVVVCLDRAPLQEVRVLARGSACGDISLKGLLGLATALRSSDVEFGSTFDARCQQTYHERVSAHTVNTIFFHDHGRAAAAAAGLRPPPPPGLLLVLSVQYGAYPPRRNADFAYETVAAILFDDGGAGPGQVYCHTQLLSDEVLEFIAEAFCNSAAYCAFCRMQHKDVHVRLIDSELSEPMPVPVAGPGLSDAEFKALAAQLEARERQERDSERAQWRLRLREIVGLLQEP